MQRARRRTKAAAVVGGLGLLASASAAAVCHPDSPGTRTLAVTGHVVGYAQHGGAVEVTLQAPSGCHRTTAWRPLIGRPFQAIRAASAKCGATRSLRGASVEVGDLSPRLLRATDGAQRAELGFDGVIHVYSGDKSLRKIKRNVRTRALKIALSGNRVVVLAAGSYQPDRPYRIEVYSTLTARFLHSWPLLARPTTLDLHGNVALFTARNSGGVFGLRLSDGKTTLLSPVQPGDRPQINRYGAVFQSNLYERLNRQGRVHMKFLPTSVINGDFAQTFDTLEPRLPIKAFAMDGPRVAVVLDAPGRACDPVRFWNVPWHSFVRINMFEDLTCAHGMQMGAGLAIAGIGAQWLAIERGKQRIIVSDSKACIEEVAGTLGARDGTPPLTGDGTLLAFGSPRGSHLEDGTTLEHEAVVLMNWKTRERTVVRTPVPALALSLDQGRVAMVRADHRVAVLAANGDEIATLETDEPHAIVLRGRELVVATKTGAIEVWDVRTQRRIHVWQSPGGTASSLDAHYGIAVFSVGRTVYALRLATGRLVALARSSSSVNVQIEAPGVVYQHTNDRGSFMKFVSLSAVERTLRQG